jgi:hypothetical protein
MTNEEAKRRICPLFNATTAIAACLLKEVILQSNPPQIKNLESDLARDSCCIGDRCGWWNSNSGRCGIALGGRSIEMQGDSNHD